MAAAHVNARSSWLAPALVCASLTGLIVVSGCANRRPVLGEQVVVVKDVRVWDPRACGVMFPRLLERHSDFSRPGYLVECHDSDGKEGVEDVRVPIWIDWILGPVALAMKGIAWLLFIIAGLGLVVRDPLRLRQSRDSLEKLGAALRARRQMLAGAQVSGDGLVRLTPLSCTRCGGVAPLVDAASICCPYCRTAIPVPEDFREPARLRRAALLAHARATRLWRVESILRSWPARASAVAAHAIGVPVLAMGVIYGFAHGFLHGAYIPFALALFIAGPILGFYSFFQRRATEPPVVSAREPLLLSAVDTNGGASCGGCRAPLLLPPPAISVVMCSYCGTEQLLLRRARRARTVAVARALASHTTLLEATMALQARIEGQWKRLVHSCWVIVLGAIVLGLVLGSPSH